MIAADVPIVNASPPSVADLLGVDREYRERADQGDLPTIAPRRLNPEGERWLPILHTTRGGRRFTALFSNTSRAHQLRRTLDWVLIYYDAGSGEQQYTVVTERKGLLARHRVVRGRESECATHYGLPRTRARGLGQRTAEPPSGTRRVADHRRRRADRNHASPRALDAVHRDRELHDDFAFPDFIGAGTE